MNKYRKRFDSHPFSPPLRVFASLEYSQNYSLVYSIFLHT